VIKIPKSEKQRAFELQLKNVKLHRRQQKRLTSLPVLEKFGIDFDENKTITLVVEELITDEKFKTGILETGILFNRLVVTAIRCPICGKKVELDKKWDTFNCSNGHELKRLEVIKMEV